MRAFVHRPLAYAVIGLAAVSSGRTLAQSDSAAAGVSAEPLEAAAVDALLAPRVTNVAEEPEEITVEGRRLSRYRLEMERAREEIVVLFNELNSGADNDVTCQKESFTGSRTRQRVCRSNSANQADARAAKSFLDSLLISSGRGGGAGGPQVNAAIGTGEAQSAAVMGRETAKAALEDEMGRLLGENRELYRAVVAYVDRRDEYNQERGLTNERTVEERAVSIELAASVLPSAQCAATATTEYRQLNTLARITSGVSISECAAASGAFTVALRVRDESGQDKLLEFSETWQRSDDQDVKFTADYPIGENMELMSTRIRGLTCTCAAATEGSGAGEGAAPP